VSIGRLTGGAGLDTLALYGGGTYRVDQLASFTGFENISLNNFDATYAFLYLGSQSIALTGDGIGPKYVYLGSGEVRATFIQEGNGVRVESTSPLNWNAGNWIVGGGNFNLIYVDLNRGHSDGAIYDLTTNTLSNILSLTGYGNNLTVRINSAIAGGVTSFWADGSNSKLVTSDAALDLSHTWVTNFTITTSNASGTNFTVQDIGTALNIAGGAGSDTITAQDFVFDANQRHVIFGRSVERIVDSSGIYTVGGNDTIFGGDDTIVGGNELSGLTEGTAVTLGRDRRHVATSRRDDHHHRAVCHRTGCGRRLRGGPPGPVLVWAAVLERFEAVADALRRRVKRSPGEIA
jgi:hypothetical protein